MPKVAASPAPAAPHTVSRRMPQDPSIPGMTVPNLRQRHYAPPAHYAVAIVDGHGRIAATSALDALGWEPGTVIAFTVDDNRLITAVRSTALSQRQSTAPRRAITPRGHLNLPVLTRRRADITSGDRLLLAADDHTGSLGIYPPKALALILQPYTTHRAQQP